MSLKHARKPGKHEGVTGPQQPTAATRQMTPECHVEIALMCSLHAGQTTLWSNYFSPFIVFMLFPSLLFGHTFTVLCYVRLHINMTKTQHLDTGEPTITKAYNMTKLTISLYTLSPYKSNRKIHHS